MGEFDVKGALVKPFPKPRGVVARVTLTISGDDENGKLGLGYECNGFWVIIAEICTQCLQAKTEVALFG